MLPVEVGGHEITGRRDAEGRGKILWVFQIDEGAAVLLNRKGLYGS
jgi:hypothetical protein